MKFKIETDADYCEECQIEVGEVLNEGSYVCRKCDKRLKRETRRTENKLWRQEERNEDY